MKTLDSNDAILSLQPEAKKREDTLTHTHPEVGFFGEETRHHVGQGSGDAKQGGRSEPRTLSTPAGALRRRWQTRKYEGRHPEVTGETRDQFNGDVEHRRDQTQSFGRLRP